MILKDEFLYNGILLKHIKIYKGYYAGENGKIYSILKTGKGANSINPYDYEKIRELKAYSNKVGKYNFIDIRHNKEYIRTSEHRLVMIAFDFKEEYQSLVVNHKNFNTKDNRPENLEWMTYKENIDYSVNNDRMSSAYKVKVTNLETKHETFHSSINKALEYIGSKGSCGNMEKKRKIIRKNHLIELI